MERSDEQILPSLYSRVGAAFNATPSQLGWITLARAVVQAVASPIGGIAGFKLNRVWVISFGCLLWGVMTVGLDPTGPSVSCFVSYCWYHAQHELTETRQMVRFLHVDTGVLCRHPQRCHGCHVLGRERHRPLSGRFPAPCSTECPRSGRHTLHWCQAELLSRAVPVCR